MPPRIDPARREIAVGTRRLPFRLDLRNDRVSVTLGGAETAVRPLQWREKVTLARFADLGSEFLRDEVIRLCTVSELPSPLAAEDAEVLWELAAWMSESPASVPVPLDSRSLATVTLRLCRAMGLKPADFDSRSAPEVEALWEALGQQAEEVVVAEDSASSSSSTTRIVIVPDEDQRTAAAHPGGRDARSTAGGTPAVREDEEAAEQTQVRAIESQSIGAVAMTAAMTLTTVHAEPRTDVIPSVGAPAAGRPVHRPLAGVARDLGAGGARCTSLAPATQVPRSTLGMTGTVGSSDRGWAMMPMPAAPPAQGTGSSDVIPSVARDLGGWGAMNVPAAKPVDDHDSTPPHDFFEELADRLEQAAAEMGLGEE